MKEKVISLEEAAATVPDGALLGLTTSALDNAPMAFLREIVRQGVKDLRVATLPGGGLNVDLLIGAGIVAEYETCHCSLGPFGPAPNFQRAIRTRRLKIKDSTWGVMYSMVQAGSMGVPFVAVRGLLGSDILVHRPDLRVVENPFQETESVVVAQPIRPEVAVFHAIRADRFGNALIPGGMRDDLMMARAGRWVVVTTEEIVEKEISGEGTGGHTFLPAVDVDQVALAPFGAHPGNCGLHYAHDPAHIREYLEAAQEEGSFQAYLEKYVYGLRNHQEYVTLSGLRSQGERGSGA